MQSAADSVGQLNGNKYLVFTTFVCGAVVMVIELLGSRVIGPPFGVSLFVWTSLITVTLVSLALGYWAGGRLVDSKGSPAALFSIILAAGIYLLLIPAAKGYVIEATLPLGLKAGSLLSSAVLFGPPLFLLGMVTPYAVKLYLAGGHEGVGSTVGWLYAVSTCGSFIGTVSTGFLLIPNLGVDKIIYLSSLSLVALSACYWMAFRKKPYLMIVALLPVAMMFFPERLPAVTRPDGTKVEVVYSKESPYGQIKIVDYSYGGTHLREFLLDNIIQGGIDVNTGLSIYGYSYYIERLAHAYKKDATRALAIGLGAGIIPARLQNLYGITTDIVEINPDVVEAADMYFPFNSDAHQTFVMDGRYFLKSEGPLYDIVVLDAFSGDITPSHLISAEAFRLVKRKLKPDGVLLINFVGGNRERDRAVPSSLSRTLNNVFRNVKVYAHKSYWSKNDTTLNFAFAASDSELTAYDDGKNPPVYPRITEDVEGIMNRNVVFPPGPFVFTDDFNPVDFLDLDVRERFRLNVLKTTDREIIKY